LTYIIGLIFEDILNTVIEVFNGQIAVFLVMAGDPSKGGQF